MPTMYGHMVGDVNCFFNDPDDPLDNVEVEVMIAEPTARRKGFATEALSAHHGSTARDELRVKGFRAQILRKNEGSRRLFQGLGLPVLPTRRSTCSTRRSGIGEAWAWTCLLMQHSGARAALIACSGSRRGRQRKHRMLTAGAGTRHCVGRVRRLQANAVGAFFCGPESGSYQVHASSRGPGHRSQVELYASGDSKNTGSLGSAAEVGRRAVRHDPVLLHRSVRRADEDVRRGRRGRVRGPRPPRRATRGCWWRAPRADVGRRVVLELLKKGRKVRALVRDLDKAQKMYAGELAGNVTNFQRVPADITQPRTLLPEYFAGVKQLVWCAATKIVPKEGDDVDRSKYYQGIKFYDPEVSGDTPEAVELRGMENVLAAIRAHGAVPLAGRSGRVPPGGGGWVGVWADRRRGHGRA